MIFVAIWIDVVLTILSISLTTYIWTETCKNYYDVDGLDLVEYLLGIIVSIIPIINIWLIIDHIKTISSNQFRLPID